MNKFSFTINPRVGNHVAIRYFYFNDIYPFCIHKERHLVTLLVFFLILHIVDSNNSMFPRNNDIFLLIFGIKYVKHLCNSYSENPRSSFVTHISQANDCESIIIDLNTLWVPRTRILCSRLHHAVITDRWGQCHVSVTRSNCRGSSFASPIEI
jgi:hypothetical protein